MKLKCAICVFSPPDPENGNQPKIRLAEYVWEGASVCEPHYRIRRTQLVVAAQQEQANNSPLLRGITDN